MIRPVNSLVDKRAAKIEHANALAAKRVTDYANDVIAGEIVAGPFVRAACRRHLNDLEHGAARGLRFDPQDAGRAIRFFPTVLKVRLGGQMVPFDLLDWQAFIVGSLFGWKAERHDLAGGPRWLRRFTESFVETGKGSGKSPLAAGIGHYMFLADGEMEPEIYAAASKRDQAMVLFRDAVGMVASSSFLSKRVRQSGRAPVWQLSDPRTRGFFKPLSSADGQSGPRPSCGLVDEVHEHKNGDILEMIKAGFKGRSEPLLFSITNSGSDVESVCYELHDHGIKVAAGDVEDDGFFSYVCGMDEGDDPLNDPTCWIKGNPSLGSVVGEDYIRRAVDDAKALSSRENLVLRLYFCVWTEAPSTWINRAAWAACEAPIRLEDYAGRDCYAGLDLSFTQDLTALALVFPRLPDDSRGAGHDVFVEFWKPKGVLSEHEKADRVPYRKWSEAGFLNTPPGMVLKLAPVAKRLGEVANDFNLCSVAYDLYRLKDLDADLVSLGLELPMMEHPQGFRRGKPIKSLTGDEKPYPLWMPESVQLFENAVIEGTVAVHVNPVLRWNVMSAVIREDPAGTENRMLDKRKSTGRIDGAVAAVMALGGASVGAAPPTAAGSYLETSKMVVL